MSANANITDQPTPYPAPLYYGSGKYYTVASVKHAEKLQKQARKAPSDTAEPQTRPCVTCGKPLPYGAQGHQLTHTGECQREHRNAMSRKYHHERKRARKEAP